MSRSGDSRGKESDSDADRPSGPRARRQRQAPAPPAWFDPGASADLADVVLREARASGALIGRLAVWSWLDDPAHHEFTKDLDVAVSPAGLRKVRAWFAARGRVVRELPIGGVNFQDRSLGVNLDFIERTQHGDYSKLFAETVKAARDEGHKVPLGTSELPLAPPEHLVAMKLLTVEPKDLRDAERLLGLEDLDVERTRAIVDRHLGPIGRNLLERALREIGHPLATRRGTYADGGSE